MGTQDLHRLDPVNSSWAIWNSEDQEDLSPILKELEKKRNSRLNPAIVFVGLNKSGQKRGKGLASKRNVPWHNFHSKKRGNKDVRLMRAFNNPIGKDDNPAYGAFMTDLFIYESSTREKDVKKTREDEKIALKHLIDVISRSGKRRFLIIMFGRRVQQVFTRHKDYLKSLEQEYHISVDLHHMLHFNAGSRLEWESEVRRMVKVIKQFENGTPS